MGHVEITYLLAENGGQKSIGCVALHPGRLVESNMSLGSCPPDQDLGNGTCQRQSSMRTLLRLLDGPP